VAQNSQGGGTCGRPSLSDDLSSAVSAVASAKEEALAKLGGPSLPLVAPIIQVVGISRINPSRTQIPFALETSLSITPG